MGIGSVMGFVGIGLLIVVQLILFAYGYGRLCKSVEGNQEQLKDHIEESKEVRTTIIEMGKHLVQINGRIDKLEDNP